MPAPMIRTSVSNDILEGFPKSLKGIKHEWGTVERARLAMQGAGSLYIPTTYLSHMAAFAALIPRDSSAALTNVGRNITF